jgi:hypothetical protein
MTDSERELIARIDADNAMWQQWMNEGPDRWASMIVNDIEHWRAYGITSVADYEHYIDLCNAKEDRKNAYADYAEECERHAAAEETAHNDAIARYMKAGEPLTFTPFAFAL